ncbi:hypothetical protein LJR219_003650 [Phenylobacterium sp. LjRoot219]|uniref:calcium-binding protein n=1 Tax=Phenylobacterium sp. LjRoot219 TaxID=3342283 RepID=UPI003ED03E13
MAQFVGTSGDDTLAGAVENDSLTGAEGNDQLMGGQGADTLQGSLGNDVLGGGAGADLVQGDDGDDILRTFGQEPGADTLEGGGGADTLSGINLNINGALVASDFAGSVFDGGAGIDYLGVGGPVTFRGSLEDMEGIAFVAPFSAPPVAAGPPVLRMRASDFDFNFNGDGVTVRGTGAVVLEVDPADNEAVDLSGVVFEPGANVSFEIAGSDANDTITGTSAGDDLDGEDGDDVLTGGGGADVFEISEGHDEITDFAKGTDKFDLSDYGFDTFANLQPYLSETAGDTVLALTYGGITNTTTFVGVTGMSADDFLFATEAVDDGLGTPSADLLPGGAGDDSLSGLAGNDTVAGFGGDDTLLGGQGNDLLTGGDGADSLGGDDGADTLQGGAENDTLGGGNGADLVQGEGGDDVLRANSHEPGADTLQGGEGADTLTAMRLTVNGNLLPGDFTGSVFDGGAGVDYLGVGGPVTFRGELEDMEGIAFVPPFSTLAGPNTIAAGQPVLTMRASDFDFNFNGDGVTLRGIGAVILEVDAADDEAVDLSGVVFEGGANVSFEVAGSDGDDTITGTSRGDDLDGEDGDDVLTGGGGADTFELSEGQDEITDFAKGTDKFDLSDYGFDTFANLQPYLSETGGNTVLTLTFGGITNTTTFVAVTGMSADDFLFATEAVDNEGSETADLLPGGPVADLLQGLGGNDTLLGFAGDDTLRGGDGADQLQGGDGADSLSGDFGSDTLAGGVGNDTLMGAAGDDLLQGEGGNDLLQHAGQSGADTLRGGDGNDTLTANNLIVNGAPMYGDFAGSVFDGGDGVDYLQVAGPVTFHGTVTNVEGLAFLPAFSTTANGANVVAQPASLTMRAAAFDFTTVRGPGGQVTLEVDASDHEAVDLSGVAFENGAPIVFTVTGSDENDTIIGTSRGDDLSGEDGDDVLTGGGGADTFELSGGHDRITDFAKGTDKFDLSDYGFDGFASLQPYLLETGGDTVLTITYGGATHTTTLVGVTGLTAGDFLFPTEPVDNEGSETADLLPGGPVADLLQGLGGNDTLLGFAGDDTLRGGDGADQLQGGDGADSLSGDAGADTITAGSGADRVETAGGGDLVSLGDGADVIAPTASFAGDLVVTDFTAGVGGDRFDLAAFLAAKAGGLAPGGNPFTTGHLRLLQNGADTQLQFDADGGGNGFVTLATLPNTTAAQLTADNFGGFAPTTFNPNANNLLTGTVGADTLDGQGGADTLSGGQGDDLLLGGEGADSLMGELGHDILQGGGGDDTLQGAVGNDLLEGGDGNDLLQHSGLSGVDTLRGGDGADTLTANNLILNGSQLYGDFAGSVFDGGAGVDYLQFAGPVTFRGELTSVEGLAFLPAFSTTAGGNTVVAQPAALTMRASAFDFTTVRGPGGQVTLEVDASDHEAVDLSGVAFEGGAPINFAITGSDANDTIIGTSRADDLDGEDGDDVLTGGAGADTFELSEGHDRITDFVKGTDKLDLSDYGFDGFASLQPYLSVVGGDTVLSIPYGGTTHTTTLVGVTGLTAGDFLFPTEPVENEGTEVADLLPGGVGDDLLDGLGGDDTLSGFAGADTLRGGGGDDLLTPGAGADVVDGGAGVDRLVFTGATPVNVNLGLSGAQNTGAGSKTISNVEYLTGTAGSDTLTGDAAANWLWGAGGAADSLNGAAGDDLLTVGAGAHTLVGGAGEDAVALTAAGAVNVSLAVLGAQTTGQGLMTFSGVERLSGTLLGDSLSGNAAANVLAGAAGGDSLAGGGGNDLLLGDGAIDVARPGDGGAITVTNDTGVSGNDSLSGGDGGDTLIGGGGNDLLTGGLGGDSLVGGAGADIAAYDAASVGVTGDLLAGTATGDGADTLSGVEHLSGSAFNDTLRGDSGANSLAGGAGADSLDGREGNDALTGGAGRDLLNGGDGDDALSGGADDDRLTGGAGDDRLDGGAGFDTADFSGSAAITVDLGVTTAQTTGQGLDTLLNIEHVIGGTAGDRLTGDANGNWLAGGGGGDTLSGAGGDDLIELGSGANSLDGGAGVDTLSFRGAAGGVEVSLLDQGVGRDTLQGVMTFSGFENLSGSTHNDTLTATADGDLLAGDLGDDSLVGGAGADLLSGDGRMAVADGGSGPIALVEVAGGGDDTIDAGSGSDTVSGGGGGDLVLLNTQAGQSARVSLGEGADVLRLNAAMRGGLVVTDFQGGPNGDVLDMEAMLAARLDGWDSAADGNPFETGHLRLVQDGAATVIEFDADGGGDAWSTLVRLENTSSLQLSAHNLGFLPLPMIVGGAGGDEFAWDPDSPADTVDGGAGVDVVNVTTPAVLVGTPTVKASPDGSALILDVDGDGNTDLTITGVEDLFINGERVVISGDLSGTGLAGDTVHYVGSGLANTFDASGVTSIESVDAQGLGGADTLLGGLADDLLDGGDGDDTLAGGADNDVLIGGLGNDTLDGGAGTADVARFSGDSTDYVVSDLGGGVLQVSGADGVDRLTGIEVLTFANGSFGQNLAPSGADATRTITAGVAQVLAASHFGFSDSQGDAFDAVRITTLPTTGELTLDQVPVTAGQVVSAEDIAAGLLVFLPDGVGSSAFTFQVRDDGVVGWGSNQDATANTLTFTVTDGSSSGGGTGGAGTGGGGGSSIITSGTSGTAAADVANLGGSADHFAAGEGGDTVTSGAGDDWVHGNAGADSLSGGAGADTLLGGRDNDRVFGDDGADQLFGDAGDDTVMGGLGDDRVEGGEGANYLRGEDGNDLVLGGSGFDNAHGNVGDDTVRGGAGDDWVLGGKDQDQLFGDAGGDILNGNMGADTVSGGDGADFVRGGQADDVLDGGAGNDWLSGDRGNDTLTGGQGVDTFHVFAGAGEDRVLDFRIADGDRVQLQTGQAYSTSQVGGDTVVDLSGGDRLVLVNVQLSSLSDGWIFAG